MNWTIDYFNIKVEDRVALGANVDFLAALQFAGAEADNVSDALTELDAAGTIKRIITAHGLTMAMTSLLDLKFSSTLKSALKSMKALSL